MLPRALDVFPPGVLPPAEVFKILPRFGWVNRQSVLASLPKSGESRKGYVSW
jgi:hypothetical protein